MDKENSKQKACIEALLIFAFILTFLLGYYVGKWLQREQMWLGGKFIHGGDIYKVEKIN